MNKICPIFVCILLTGCVQVRAVEVDPAAFAPGQKGPYMEIQGWVVKEWAL